ncbi:ANTAR domain-containing protein [Geodermatophilus sp. DF01-2]|nr:ANTAR domain-containing protein [Geodermatophilus sp. DF01_2]
MGQVARALQEEHGDVEATLRTITATAVGTIPGAEECSITYVTGRERVEPRAATGDLPARMDELQNRVQEGPCLDAVWEEETVRIEDMRAERRWPRFAAEAVELGVMSSLSFRLFVDGDNLGALNVYAREPQAFGKESEEVGLVLAAHAAVALAGARHESDLRQAVSSRDVIGQAKGILMERHRLTADQAFQVLARVSQQTNRKLVDIAEELTRTGAMPGAG